ncbi:T9SS type A sorting domain-containing protein [Flavobacterium enshiense]|nr:T9SS type A sorting domain-containing protein [Flavobacterium enshiense]
MTVAFLFSTLMAFSQGGNIDPTFNTLDSGFGNGDGFDNYVWTTVIQNDGKIIVGGSFSKFNGTAVGHIVRLNADGTLDTTFIMGTGFDADVNSICIQPDGKIIVGGNFEYFNGTSRRGIARLNTDGSLDTFFNAGNGFTGVTRVCVQPDGKIIAGGGYYNFSRGVTRLNPDGSLDTSFNPGSLSGSGLNGYVNSIFIQSDGKIILGGVFTAYNNVSINRIIRLNPDSTLDTSFNPGTGFNLDVNSISVQSDGKIIVGGMFTSFNGTSRKRIARLNSDGSLDSSFDPGGGFNDVVYSTSIQPDGKIIVGGGFINYRTITTRRNNIARLNSDASVDVTFDPGIGFDGIVHSTAIQSDGKIIVGGKFFQLRGTQVSRIARLNVDSSSDNSFNAGTGCIGTVSTTAVQSDGKIIAGGQFWRFNGRVVRHIARLNSDGSFDETFNVGTGFDGPTVIIVIQPDGKIIVGGSFDYFNGIYKKNIARLNVDGSLDTTFSIGTGFNSSVRSIAVQSDGKIIVGGEFDMFNNVSRNRIARLNADGSLDTSFNPGTGFNNTVYSVKIQSDGKLILGGEFQYFNSISRNRIARLNTDGSLDTSFNPGNGFSNSVYATSIQSDGKIVAAGFFDYFNGVLRKCLVRLNADGSLDTSFNVGSGFGSRVSALCVQSDGKILAGGWFTVFNNVSSKYIVRLNTDGSLDNTFNTATGFSELVRTIFQQSDGKIIVGGDFTSYKGVGRNRILRLVGNGTLAVDNGFFNDSLKLFPNPSNGQMQIDLGDTYLGVEMDVVNALGQRIKSDYFETCNKINLSIDNEPGIYFIKLVTASGNEAVLKAIKM